MNSSSAVAESSFWKTDTSGTRAGAGGGPGSPGAHAAAVRIVGLSKEFQIKPKSHMSLKALEDINLTIAKGELLALLGPSGCGESTLLHVIDGIVEARGSVWLDDELVTGPGFGRGMVFQEYALFPWRTVIENVTFGLEMKGVSRKKRLELAQDHILMVGLAGFENRFPYQLSGGMKQRVAIARALAYDPEVLLLDEPFAALDAQTREILPEELFKIWERTGKTILFVTHGIEEAGFLAQRVAVMTARPGRIKALVDVPISAPRYLRKDLRSTAEFAAIRHHLWELLSMEVVKEREGLSAAARETEE